MSTWIKDRIDSIREHFSRNTIDRLVDFIGL